MVNVIDFFPTLAQSHAERELPHFAISHNASSALVMDLPLRYVFQYALNHLRKDEQQQRTVLIVVDSKAKLRSLMCQEQQGQLQQEQTHRVQDSKPQGVHSFPVVVGPWQHLFPLQGETNPQDEFTSATQTLTQTQEHTRCNIPLAVQVSAPESDLSVETVGKEEFQAEQWSRIQIRYAPTVHHVQSLFRCLHLDSETTFGKTFGHEHRQVHSPVIEDHGLNLDEQHSAEEEGTGKVHTRQSPRSMDMPTLVMLIGCFQDRSLRDDTEGMGSSSLCVLPNHLPYTGSSNNNGPSMKAPMATPALIESSQFSTTHQTESSIQQPFLPLATQTPLQALATRYADEDRERLNYIRAVSQTMSEVKDGLDWIERTA
ncbi:hypothetical protein BGZ65_009724 [Modicella reniformis]|uniref:Uncharacterized protein n=1 Tax=Modicella reniformis TaxID=1440133 RepID=A0A9P6MDY1_9FUNG|nr:hypothetical protein BGZ65_009724 [Modicella reniformis]